MKNIFFLLLVVVFFPNLRMLRINCSSDLFMYLSMATFSGPEEKWLQAAGQSCNYRLVRSKECGLGLVKKRLCGAIIL